MEALSILEVLLGKRMGRLAADAVASRLALLAFCGGSTPASASCRDASRWHGRQYLGVALTLKHPLPAAEATISVSEPFCNDGGDPTNAGGVRSLDVVQCRGIPASIMLGDRSPQPRIVYLTGDS